MGLIELAHLSKMRPLEELIAEFASFEEEDPPRRPEVREKRDNPLSVPGIKRPSASNPNSKEKAAFQVKPPALASERQVSAEPLPASDPEISSAIQDPRAFLLRIAAGVGRESLESLLQSLDGARLHGERLVLEPGTASDFVLRQIKENLSAITQAARNIIGSTVTVVLGEEKSHQAPKSKSKSKSEPKSNENSPLKGSLLEKAKREPVIKSFLDVFPGPVKAEKIDT
jgi:hypothetical protein